MGVQSGQAGVEVRKSSGRRYTVRMRRKAGEGLKAERSGKAKVGANVHLGGLGKGSDASIRSANGVCLPDREELMGCLHFLHSTLGQSCGGHE